jgi:molybdopterin synthase sulfur carrier subunit
MGTGGDTLATVYIPSLMQKITDGRAKVEISGSTVRQIVDNLEKDYPGMKERLVQENRIKGNISVAVDGEITTLGMLEKVGEDSEVHFLPAIGGGSTSVTMPLLRTRV